MNSLFQNALKRAPQKTPPVWFMRQAGRYHNHYQNLRARHSFMDLCKQPELAAQVALGPVQDFDFDAHEINREVAPINFREAHGVFLRRDDRLCLAFFGAIDRIDNFLLREAMMVGKTF